MPMSVLSNKPDDWTNTIVAQLLAGTPFAQVRGQQRGVPRKPDPTAALALASAMEVASEETAFVGDTLVDMRTARAAGMRPVAVTWGFTEASTLERAGAAHVVATMAELQTILAP